MSATRAALRFAFAEKYGSLLLSVGSSMVLARLLSPAEAGVYSVAAVLLALVQVVRDFGAGQFLIQTPVLTDQRLRAVLAVSVLFSWPLALLVLFGSGLVATFYHELRLGNVLRLLSLNFFLIPLTSVSLPVLRRQLRFGAICMINLGHGICNAAVAISLAWLGWGVMSMAWASVAATLAALAIGLWVRPPQLPWLPGWSGVREVFQFGAYATGGTLVDEVGVAAPDLVIGKWIGMDGVGLFGKAMALLAVFNQAITSVLSPVLYPLFASRARDGGDSAAAYLHAVSYLTVCAWPFFGFVGVMAQPLVELLYGKQWLGAVVLIQIMCCSAGIYSMFSMARFLFVATGHVRQQAHLDCIAVPVRIGALMVAAPCGLVALAWAVVVGSLFRSCLTAYYLRRLAGISLGQLMRASRTSILPALLVVGTALAVGTPDALSAHAVQLPLAGAASAFAWLAGMWAGGHPLRAELSAAWQKWSYKPFN